jgi:hypothetical protein
LPGGLLRWPQAWRVGFKSRRRTVHIFLVRTFGEGCAMNLYVEYFAIALGLGLLFTLSRQVNQIARKLKRLDDEHDELVDALVSRSLDE